MQVYVQKSASTTFPSRSAGVSGGEFSQPVAPSKPGMWPSTGSDPALRRLLNRLTTPSAARSRPRPPRLSSADSPERGAELVAEEIGLFPRGEVAAPVDLAEVDEGRVDGLRPAGRGRDDLAGERGEAARDRDRRRSLARRETLRASALPVRPGRRGAGARQPVQRDVVEDVVPGEIAHGLAVDEGAGDLVVAVRVVVEHPRGHGDGCIEQGIAVRLRPRGLLEEVAEAARLE